MVTFTLTVFCALLCLLRPVGAFPQPGYDRRDIIMVRHTVCHVHLEYSHNGICCLNCEAGEYVKSPCTKAGRKGTCEECMFGTFTEHANGINQCFKCTQCRPDQEMVSQCTPTQDTQCRCKPGGFCHPDEACEVCKKCSRCKGDEGIVRNCTPTTDTECKKIQPRSESSSDAVIVGVVLGVLFLVFLVGMVYMWRRRRTSGTQGGPSGNQTTEKDDSEVRRTVPSQSRVHCVLSPGLNEESRTLIESNSSSASNSQLSLTNPTVPVISAAPTWAGSRGPLQPSRREDEPFPTLVPLNGVESLRNCFDLFGELDMDFHKRFFRGLGLNDNVIKSKEHLTYEDKVHELLNIWVEQEGRNANLNNLLKVLLDLNQRRTAEMVKEKAIQSHHYCCEH